MAAADVDAVHVITAYRRSNCNLRTQLFRFIAKAGLKPWPKLFQNLRSTRQTELAENYPMQVVCAWIGNSEDIAREHYLQVTDEHFERASRVEISALTSASGTPATCNESSESFALVAKQWPNLPEVIRQRILGFVEGSLATKNAMAV